jgi:hypothetical protein
LALGKVDKGEREYDWAPVDALLTRVARRGHDATFRFYLEYLNKTDGIPAYSIKNGLKVHQYTNTAPLPPTPVETPDYEDKNLRLSLQATTRQ